MKSKLACLALTVAGFCALNFGASAGTFKHITIDGSFGDWTGVPVAYTQAQDVFDVVAYKEVYLANDEDYLYVRFNIYGDPTNAFTGIQNVFINADNSLLTGYTSHGVQSELLIQAGAGYQQKSGVFNAGAINGLNWQGMPMGPATEFEFRVSLHATNVSDSTPVFSSDGLSITLESDTAAFAPREWFPPSGGGVAYTFATPPPTLPNNLGLVDMSTSSWQVNASGSDLSTNWLDQLYDDSTWTSGLGLFGYTPSGAYPAIQTPLVSGPTTYYFRTHFNWDYNGGNVAFVVTNYLSDGAVYYLNGAEVKRVRMPAGSVAYDTNAIGTNALEGSASFFGISGGPLLPGDNILEVETHQAPGSSADMVHGLSLTAATQFPVIIMNTNLPANVAVVGGNSATFTSDVIGSGPLSYQWMKNGTNIPNATDPTLTIPVVVTNDAGNYTLVVSNSMSTATTRTAALVVTGTPIVFTDPTKPADKYVVRGRAVTFNVVATGSALVQYQWYQGVNPIANATNASYSISSVDPTNAGLYYVTVINPVSSTNSRTATLTVLPDAVAAAVTSVTASPHQVSITFSEPVTAITATNVANYTIDGVANVTNAVLNGQTVTLYPAATLALGTTCSISINGVTDVYGNVSHTTVSAVSTISIDGNISDWDGVTPVYSAPIGTDGAADFKDIYVYNDANYQYFRVTLWHDIPAVSGFFPKYCNMFFNTDNNSASGYSAVGSEFLQQSSSFYQEKGGGFNEGQVLVGMAAGYLIRPNVRETTFPADFEIRYPRNATFSVASGGGLVFSTNVINFLWVGQTPGFLAVNTAAVGGMAIPATNVVSTVQATLPPGPLAITPLLNNNVAVTWDSPGTLQFGNSLGNTWTNVPTATSPYVLPTSGTQKYFRLMK